MTSEVTATNQVTLLVTLNGGQCQYPTDAAMTVTLGTKVRAVDMGPTGSLIITATAARVSRTRIPPHRLHPTLPASRGLERYGRGGSQQLVLPRTGPQAGNTIAVVAATPEDCFS